MEKRRKLNKKRVALAVLLVVLIAGVIGGTISWLTKTDSINNVFTVGSFNVPTTDPTDPTQTISISSNLYEPSWDPTDEHKLMPGVSFDKDPYVGIGQGSEDAVVYVYVNNKFSNKVYFEINNGWEAIDATAGSKSGTYTKGLFKYTAGLSNAASADVWTATPLFSEVEIASNANSEDFVTTGDKEIIVSSFIHQAKDDQGTAIDDATVIRPAARAAFNLD